MDHMAALLMRTLQLTPQIWVLLDRGFAYCYCPHPRWIRWWVGSGMKMVRCLRRRTPFTDFVDCKLNILIDQKIWTSADHLVRPGWKCRWTTNGSNCQYVIRKLYNGVIAAVPFVDVVSLPCWMKAIPLTSNEWDEWGNPKNNKDSYDYMLIILSLWSMLTAQEYPHMLLVTTGLFDSQVQYWEPAKWVAKLRDKKTDNNVLLLETNMEAGHGGASGRFKRYRETALKYAFLMKLEGKM